LKPKRNSHHRSALAGSSEAERLRVGERTVDPGIGEIAGGGGDHGKTSRALGSDLREHGHAGVADDALNAAFTELRTAGVTTKAACAERDAVLALINTEQYADLSIGQVWTRELDEGRYLNLGARRSFSHPAVRPDLLRVVIGDRARLGTVLMIFTERSIGSVMIMLSPKNREAPKIPSAANAALVRRPPDTPLRWIRVMSAQDAALPVVVGAHHQQHVLDRHDDRHRPEDQRDDAVDAVRGHGHGVRVGGVEDRLDGVDRAGADVAEDDAQRTDRERQLRGGTRCGGTGIDVHPTQPRTTRGHRRHRRLPGDLPIRVGGGR
jgi:hypothetical protein